MSIVDLTKKYLLEFDGKDFSVNGKVAPPTKNEYKDNYANIYSGVFRKTATNTTVTSDSPAKFKLYSLWMKDNQNEINLVPVNAPFKTDGKKNCMFDTIEKKLYCSQGSADFITD